MSLADKQRQRQFKRFASTLRGLAKRVEDLNDSHFGGDDEVKSIIDGLAYVMKNLLFAFIKKR